MNSVLLVRLKTLRWVVSTSADYSSLSLLVSCWEKVVFPPREGCRTGRKTRAKRKAPCQHSQAQPSAAKGEGSCHREPMGPWLGLWGSFCSGVGESKPRVGKESLKGIWGRHREQETAEITWEQAARWLGCQKKAHPWDPEGAVCNFLQPESYWMLLHWESAWKKGSLYQGNKRIWGSFVYKPHFNFLLLWTFLVLKKSSELWCWMSAMYSPAKPCRILRFKALSTV